VKNLNEIFENSHKASRAAQNAIANHMWPAGRVFKTPGLGKSTSALLAAKRQIFPLRSVITSEQHFWKRFVL